MAEKETKTFLNTSEWVWLVVVIATASVANMAGLHAISTGLRDEMLDLDSKWQQRSEAMQRDIRSDLKELQQAIPPTWFRDLVSANQLAIKEHDKRLDQLEKAKP